MVRSIYSARFFVIQDHTGTSTERRQNAGIAQGCPLSPYLFIAVQTVMLHDAIDSLHLEEEPGYVVTRDVLYADDTLLVSQHQSNLQNMLNAIIEEGRNYGLELNWGKTVQMQISTNQKVTTPSGSEIKTVRDAVYLGGLLTCDGRASAELCRRLGEASKLFKQLNKLWSHASLGWRRKRRIYDSVVLSKLLYSLDSLWSLKADRCRLDAFHCRCLRRILGIPHSFISRISNTSVLDQAGAEPLSQVLAGRQTKLYQKIVAYGPAALVNRILCNGDGSPKNWARKRRRGRPRRQWASSDYNLLLHV